MRLVLYNSLYLLKLSYSQYSGIRICSVLFVRQLYKHLLPQPCGEAEQGIAQYVGMFSLSYLNANVEDLLYVLEPCPTKLIMQ